MIPVEVKCSGAVDTTFFVDGVGLGGGIIATVFEELVVFIWAKASCMERAARLLLGSMDSPFW